MIKYVSVVGFGGALLVKDDKGNCLSAAELTKYIEGLKQEVYKRGVQQVKEK